MQLRRLGNSDLMITPVGMGAWAIGGGDYAFGWGDQDDQDSIDCIYEAVHAGINWIDTAPVYGLGRSEEIVGRAIAGMTEKPYVFTKCERVWNENREISARLKRESVMAECEDSLRRLGVDVIDLYQIHWPQPEEDIEEGWQAVMDLKRQGKIRWGGVSNFNADQMARVQPLGEITSLQPPYSALRRDIEASILPHCAEHGIGVLSYSPMASGLLSGKMTRERVQSLPENDWRSRSTYYQEPMLTRNLAIAAKLGEIGARHGQTTGATAISWVLNHQAVTGAIVGLRKPGQVQDLIGAMDFRLSADEVNEVEATLSS